MTTKWESDTKAKSHAELLADAAPQLAKALNECQKQSWWSENDNPSNEELRRRLGRILMTTRDALRELHRAGVQMD